MSSTNWARNKNLDKQFGAVDYTPPATYYVGLSTTNISVTGSNATEPSGAAYARVALTNDKTSFTYSSSGCIVNSASIIFAESSGSWGTAVNLGLWDALTSGSIWYYTAITPLVIQTLTTVQFSASSIAISQT
jgi:hypothetical protein